MIVRYEGTAFEVYLEDDGTLDTVITVDGVTTRFDSEYAAQYRNDDGAMTLRGLKALAIEAIKDGLFETEVEG